MYITIPVFCVGFECMGHCVIKEGSRTIFFQVFSRNHGNPIYLVFSELGPCLRRAKSGAVLAGAWLVLLLTWIAEFHPPSPSVGLTWQLRVMAGQANGSEASLGPQGEYRCSHKCQGENKIALGASLSLSQTGLVNFSSPCKSDPKNHLLFTAFPKISKLS